MLVIRRSGAQPRVFRDARLWRAVDVYRAATLCYAVAIFVPVRDEYRHPTGAIAVLGVMTAWTVYLHVRRAWWRHPVEGWVLGADLVLSAVLIVVTLAVDDPVRIAGGEATLPSIWAAAAVGGLAVGRGWRAGLFGALVIGSADFVEVWPRVASGTIDSLVQLVLLGTVTGYIVELYTAGRRDLARAVALEAASRERERLAADIHDSVLQVLAYVQRRGVEVGGEAAEIGPLAGEGARAWVLVESELDVVSAPGEGTEIELRVPRRGVRWRPVGRFGTVRSG